MQQGGNSLLLLHYWSFTSSKMSQCETDRAVRGHLMQLLSVYFRSSTNISERGDADWIFEPDTRGLSKRSANFNQGWLKTCFCCLSVCVSSLPQLDKMGVSALLTDSINSRLKSSFIYSLYFAAFKNYFGRYS